MKHILTIDDSKTIHAFLDRCFENTSYKLSHALTASEGLDFIKRDGESVSLILLDWEMPVMTGPELMIKFNELQIKIPVVMLTSKNKPEDITQMLSVGVAEYIMKPFTPEIVLDKIQAVLECN